jgi:hypothetical protein
MDPKPQETKPEYSTQDLEAHVAEAHGILKRMREQLNAHPDLDLAIEKLEMALSILTTNSGGML